MNLVKLYKLCCDSPASLHGLKVKSENGFVGYISDEKLDYCFPSSVFVASSLGGSFGKNINVESLEVIEYE